MALTDIGLKALRPREKVYVISDARGLYVEVFPSGGVVWRYRYRINGRSESSHSGSIRCCR
jgi:hypothetical protein